MVRQRFQRAAPEKRDALLDAAAKEFAEHGYETASLNRMLLAAGLSKGSFYYYFDDKADLAAAVMARESSRWIEIVGSLKLPSTPGEFWAEMERLNERGMAEIIHAPGGGNVLARLAVAASREPALRERFGPFIVDARKKIEAFYKRGQEIGAVRSDISVSALMTILQGTKQAVGMALLPTDRAPTAEELAEFARVNLDCLRRISAPSSEGRSQENDR
jgi:AcrR family transcriptional regulator